MPRSARRSVATRPGLYKKRGHHDKRCDQAGHIEKEHLEHIVFLRKRHSDQRVKLLRGVIPVELVHHCIDLVVQSAADLFQRPGDNLHTEIALGRIQITREKQAQQHGRSRRRHGDDAGQASVSENADASEQDKAQHQQKQQACGEEPVRRKIEDSRTERKDKIYAVFPEQVSSQDKTGGKDA